jgi:16S rRNA (guanine527-N7)-methyltransferase
MNHFEPLGINPTLKEAFILDRYYKFLVEKNKVMNLTGITDYDGVYYKHFYDSLSLNQSIDLKTVSTMLDIGSGAGFPGIVIKIFYPHIKLTIVDSLGKRITFLKELAEYLGLTGIDFVCDRAENYIKQRRNYYDLVTARAVAPIDILDELAIPFVKVGGYLIAMKASNFKEELSRAEKGIEILGGKVTDIISFNLPNDLGERHLLKIKKVTENNRYPREFKDIKKKPL